MTFFGNLRLAALYSALPVMLGGCVILDTKMVSDEQLVHKAAITLNVSDSEVTISNRSVESGQGGNTLHFTATTKNGSKHRCYIGVGFAGLLDAAATCAGL